MNARMEGRATLVWRGLVCVLVDGGVFEVETRSGWGQDGREELEDGMGWDGMGRDGMGWERGVGMIRDGTFYRGSSPR